MPTPERSLIGKNITITGDISAKEDLVIEGRVVGKVNLHDSRLTVGEDGHAQSQINAREVVISGRVDGQIHASERVELRHTALVTGDIVAPRLIIHQDAVMKGSIDLSSALVAKQKPVKKEVESESMPHIDQAAAIPVQQPAYAS